MKFIATIAAFVAGAISMASAQDAGLNFTYPTAGAVLQAGAPYAVTWNWTNPQITQIDNIELRSGNATNFESIQNITTSIVYMSVRKFDWVPSTALSSGVSYYLAAKSFSGESLSPVFAVVNQAAGNQAAPATINTAVVAATTASPVSAASSFVAASSPSASVSAAASLEFDVATSAAASLKAGLVGIAAVGSAIVILA